MVTSPVPSPSASIAPASVSPGFAEDSIALRVFAQTLVIIGIVATMLAANDVAEPVVSGYWAIPMSIAGAVWSYRQRRKRNIAFKFLIAIGMLWALSNFLGNLVSQANDTRLILADLLIQLQALHCFDLPRRKDLGYSIVIGLILLGVAATLSQTLTFGPFLIVFLAVALPVLVLDYRSRLGLNARLQEGTDRPKQRFSVLTGLAPRRLGWVLLAAIALGLTIFACLPRLPGYQLRSFPVSAAIDIAGEFDNQSISNPGYVSNPNSEDGDEENGDGTGSVQGGGGSPQKGPGEMDETHYYGFNTTINQNLRGEMKPQIVMRVRSQAEGFWRVMAFDHYTGQGWEVSRNEETQTLTRSALSYRFLIPRFAPVGDHRSVVQTYTIVAEKLPNLLPALLQPDEVYFPTRQLGVDQEGGLRAPVELSDGITYTVVSDVPYRNRTALNQAGSTYPASISAFYLDVPENLADRLRQKTEELLRRSPNPLTTPYEQALYLAQSLKQQYQLQGDLPFLAEGEDLVEAFLFTNEGGYPDHFSTTLTILLRSIGIPARLVVGYGPGEFNPFTGLYVVRNTDAYAMTEVFFPRYGWFAFDPIPGHELFPPSLEADYRFSTLKKLWLWVAGWLPSPLRGFLTLLFLRITTGALVAVRWVLSLLSRGIFGFIAGTMILLSVAFLLWLLWNGFQGWRDRRRLRRLHPLERIYQQMLADLKHQGFPKHPAQTPLEYARYVGNVQTSRCPEVVALAIEQIALAYVSWRYGGRQPDLPSLEHHLKTIQNHYRRPAIQQWAKIRN